MKRKINILKKGTGGITLIALVITIIVLLILAAISMLMLTGENSILNRAGEAKEDTSDAQKVESIKIGILSTITNGNVEYSRDNLEEELLKQDLGENVQVVAEDGEYKYIVNVDEESYGVKNNNEVVKLKGIIDEYIYVSKVLEDTPKYQFENTVSQKKAEDESGFNNTTYEVEGISLEENGEYVTSGTIEGKSGTLEIKDLQTGTYEYTLTNFFRNDEVFYAKIKIGDSLEKIQKLTIVQGDVVQYESNFVGIVYNPDEYEDEEDEMCEGGMVRRFNKQIDIRCTFYGKKLDYSRLGGPDDYGTFSTSFYYGERDQVGRDNRINGKAELMNFNGGTIKELIKRSYRGGWLERFSLDESGIYTLRIYTSPSGCSLDSIWIYK